MTIINLASDGLHSQLIVIARVAFKYGPIDRDELLSVCAVPDSDGKDRDSGRLRAVLARWLELGLFVEEAGKISLKGEFKRGTSLDELTDRLPVMCRRLALEEQHCLPLWASEEVVTEKGAGRAADFARGLSWALAQDIYSLPSSADDIAALEQGQVLPPRFIFQNKDRWSGLRLWSRYLGFASGDENNFLLDPTDAVRDELSTILGKGETMAAEMLLDELSARLPVLDGGKYRAEVEANLRPESWRQPAGTSLSMSLSMALRRLELNGTIVLETKADAGTVYSLTGRSFRTWTSFTHVRMAGEQK